MLQEPFLGRSLMRVYIDPLFESDLCCFAPVALGAILSWNSRPGIHTIQHSKSASSGQY